MSARLPTTLDMLTRLVAAPSVSSLDPTIDQSNRQVLDHLATWLEALGFELDFQPVTGRDGKFNLVAVLSPTAAGGASGSGLVLAGHSDTVPCNPELWRSDPFKLSVVEERAYGLGATDMKCFFPLIFEALNGLDLKALQAPLVVLATADEECCMSGARSLASGGRALAGQTLIGEPTGIRPVIAHKGVCMFAIEIIGRAGHASDPGLGHNAIEAMWRVISALDAWRASLQTRYRDDRFKIPTPTLNYGSIRGGDNPNRICGSCELQIDIRLLPGMDAARLAAELDHCLQECLDGSPFKYRQWLLSEPVPAHSLDEDAELVKFLADATGRAPATVAFGTEAPFFSAMHSDTVIIGPGDIDCAHQPDEYVELARFAPYVKTLQSSIQKYCLTP